jgi:hypothetical protein
MVLATAVAVFRLLDQRNLSPEFFRSCRYGERKRNFVGQHFWARGYWVSTVSRDEAMIREYIRNQEQEDQRLDQINLWMMIAIPPKYAVSLNGQR